MSRYLHGSSKPSVAAEQALVSDGVSGSGVSVLAGFILWLVASWRNAMVFECADRDAQSFSFIGFACVDHNGTIRVRILSRQGRDSDIALAYPFSHARYKEVRAYLGAIETSEVMPLVSWPFADTP